MRKILASFLALAALPAVAAHAQSAISASDDAGIKRAVAAREEREGYYGAAQIGTSPYYAVYVFNDGKCGSGGCRPQIWKKGPAGFEYLNSISVSSLPLVILPTSHQDMPDIGVTVFFNKARRQAIMPVMFDGTTYAPKWSEDQLPATAGKVLIKQESLKPYR